jgi:isopentenyl phosphate kinase
VTGGMLAKVAGMVNLVRQRPGLEAQLISGEQEGALRMTLERSTEFRAGTVIRW